MTHHRENCNAPLCMDSTTEEEYKEVIWYAGEEICGVSPYNDLQKKQSLINRCFKKGQLEDPKKWWTAETIDKLRKVQKKSK